MTEPKPLHQEPMRMIREAVFMIERCSTTVPAGWAIDREHDRSALLSFLPLPKPERSTVDQLLAHYPGHYPLAAQLAETAGVLNKDLARIGRIGEIDPTGLDAADQDRLKVMSFLAKQSLLLIQARQQAAENSDKRLPPQNAIDALVAACDAFGTKAPTLEHVMPGRGGRRPPKPPKPPAPPKGGSSVMRPPPPGPMPPSPPGGRRRP